MKTGTLFIESWAGRIATEVEVLQATPRMVLIRAITRTKLPRRWLAAGDQSYVPASAIRVNQEQTTPTPETTP